MKKIIYVDNNATTCVAPEVFQEMTPFLTEEYGNPSSPHPFGDLCAKAIRTARESIAELLDASPEELIFTSCGTESDNSVLFSAIQTQAPRRKIVTTAVEHPAILNTCKYLEENGFAKIVYIGVDEHGRLDMRQAEHEIDEETALVTCMWANNETGNIHPILELAQMAKAKGALFHTDAVQATGKLPIRLNGSNIDFLSISGHKLHAPKGIGVLYRQKGVPFVPFMKGGHQEKGLRAGTENVASIVGLGAAARLAMRTMNEENTRVRQMRDRLEAAILADAPDAFVNGDIPNRLPNTTNIAFKYVEGEAILLRMYGAAGICASSGSACSSGSLEASHVLRAMHVDYQALHGSIRFSLSHFNTDQEIDTIIATVPKIIRDLRAISPFGK